MRANEFLVEYRDRLLQYVKSLLPTWPEYVLKDWLVPNKGNFSNLPVDAVKNGIMEKVQGAGLTPNSKWQLVPDMKFTMNMFEPKTKQRLIGRAGGSSDLGMGIPRDKERHATQATLAQQQGGVRKEPVLLIKTAKGYELLEGWHRTIQHFAKYPDGYTGPAYVAVAQGQPGVAEGSLNEYKNTALEEFNGLEFRFVKDDPYIRVGAFAPKTQRQIAQVDFKILDNNGLEPQDLHVEERFRGQGIAKIMYDFVKNKGYKIHRSWSQTDAGADFWDKHRGQERVWEQGVAEGVYRGDWVRHPDNPWQIGQIQSIDNGQASVTWKKTDKRKKAMSSTHAVDALQHARREFSQLTQPTHTPGMAEGKVKLHTDPGYFGAEVDDTGFDSLPVVNIPANKLVGFEPDSKMNQPKSQANVKKIVADLKKGDKLPPLLVRKYKNGYQVLDGHHRFWAYKLLGTTSIPVRIVADKDIEEISKQGVAENFADGRNPQDKGDSQRHGIPKKATMAQLEKAAKASGRKGQLARWQLNMRRGRKK